METFQRFKFRNCGIVSEDEALTLQQIPLSSSMWRVLTFACLLSHLSLHTLVI